jgi:hypothetical protein
LSLAMRMRQVFDAFPLKDERKISDAYRNGYCTLYRNLSLSNVNIGFRFFARARVAIGYEYPALEESCRDQFKSNKGADLCLTPFRGIHSGMVWVQGLPG